MGRQQGWSSGSVFVINGARAGPCCVVEGMVRGVKVFAAIESGRWGRETGAVGAGPRLSSGAICV